jgi:hypothetical protein
MGLPVPQRPESTPTKALFSGTPPIHWGGAGMEKEVTVRLRALAVLAARDGICLITTRRAGGERGFLARAYYGDDATKDFEEAAPTLLRAITAVADRLHRADVAAAVNGDGHGDGQDSDGELVTKAGNGGRPKTRPNGAGGKKPSGARGRKPNGAGGKRPNGSRMPGGAK